MNSQRTLEIIRDELQSDSLKECEGSYWDCSHPHMFVVMGASVSMSLNRDDQFYKLKLTHSQLINSILG